MTLTRAHPCTPITCLVLLIIAATTTAAAVPRGASLHVNPYLQGLPAELAARNYSGHIAFWHIPKSAGSAIATAVFDGLKLNAEQRRVRTVESADRCGEAIMRILNITDRPFFHIHHKDFSFVTALKRLGFRLFTVLRHPVRRAISAYFYHTRITKAWAGNGKKLSLPALSFLLKDDSVSKSVSGVTNRWSFACNWQKCMYPFCKDVTPGPATAESKNMTRMHSIMTTTFEHIGCSDDQINGTMYFLRKMFNLPTLTFSERNSHSDIHTGNVATRAEFQALQKRSVDYALFSRYCGTGMDVLEPYVKEPSAWQSASKPSQQAKRAVS